MCCGCVCVRCWWMGVCLFPLANFPFNRSVICICILEYITAMHWCAREGGFSYNFPVFHRMCACVGVAPIWWWNSILQQNFLQFEFSWKFFFLGLLYIEWTMSVFLFQLIYWQEYIRTYERLNYSCMYIYVVSLQRDVLLGNSYMLYVHMYISAI